MMIGQTFGRLTVMESAGYLGRSPAFVCLCECGKSCTVRKHHLLGGKQRSCGCLHREELVARNLLHGHAVAHQQSPEFRAWCAMKGRCNNPNNEKYPSYGARGISVSPLWEHDFSAFLSHIGPKPGRGYSVDRIDTDGNYEPGNVKWSTAQEQRVNQRRVPPERRPIILSHPPRPIRPSDDRRTWAAKSKLYVGK